MLRFDLINVCTLYLFKHTSIHLPTYILNKCSVCVYKWNRKQPNWSISILWRLQLTSRIRWWFPSSSRCSKPILLHVTLKRIFWHACKYSKRNVCYQEHQRSITIWSRNYQHFSPLFMYVCL